MNHDIPIVAIGYNRPQALWRLLDSLASADYEFPVKLYISLDGGGGEETAKVAEAFHWTYGEKAVIRHEQNLGLREHVLSCGDLALIHDGIIALEDDLAVAPQFYSFALQAYSFFKDDRKIGGISLYHHAYNETAQFPFMPHSDGADVYFLKYASSWGQMWTKAHWQGFRKWYGARPADDKLPKALIPPNILLWPDNSWKKHFIHYLALHDLYFVFPRVSLTTIFSDEGTNIRIRETFLQVPLWQGKRPFIFISTEDSAAVYDTWCEILPDRLRRIWKEAPDKEFDVDLYGMKPAEAIQASYLISGRRCRAPIMKIGREMKPHEANLLGNIEGDYFSLGNKEDFEEPPYLARLLKCHEKKELSYWYPIREYHFHRNALLSTSREAYSLSDPPFLFRKFMSTARYALRYFGRK